MSSNPVVVSMPRASLIENDSVVELHFKNSDNSIQHLRFSPETFLGLLSRAVQLFLDAQTRKATKSGHLEVQPIPISAANAQESVGSNTVILSVRMQNSTPAWFSMQIAEAEELHRQLGQAVQKAKHQSSNSRH